MAARFERCPAGSIRVQSGIGLAETLVALGLSALILLGLGTLFAASKKAYNVNEAIARMQEDGRHAIEILESHLSLAGRAPLYPTGLSAGSALGFAWADSHRTALNPSDSDTDSIRVNVFRFDEVNTQGVGLCDGATRAGTFQDSFHFYVRSGALYCDSETGRAAKLVPGVAEMAVIYGEDTDSDGYPNRWISLFTSAEQVVAVRVRIRLQDTEQDVDTIGLRDFHTTVRFRQCAGC